MACRDLGNAKCAGTQTASAAGVMALPESFLEPLVADDQKTSLASLSPWLHLFRHLEGSFAWGPSLLLGTSGTLRDTLGGVLLCSSVCWCLMGQPLYCSAANAGMRRERGNGDGSTLTHDSAVSPCFHGCLVFQLAFPTTISSLSSPRYFSLQSTAALALGLLHNP